ncbi:MAG: hypothetical protein AAFX85_11325, partial [Pseudomonadota bacterium]
MSAPETSRVAFARLLATLAFAIGVASTAQGAAFAPLPDIVVCSVEDPLGDLPWDRVVFYVSVRLEDGG